MAFSTVAASGGPLARPRGLGAWSVSSAMSRVAGSFFRAKYSDTPLGVSQHSCEA